MGESATLAENFSISLHQENFLNTQIFNPHLPKFHSPN